MKCPLLKKAKADLSDLIIGEPSDCLKEECAWWTNGEEDCVILFIERDLAGIWTLLTTIANKMPHEAQFRK